MKSVLITGASQGIGLACAQHYLSQGWKVFAIDKNPSALQHAQLENISADLSASDFAKKLPHIQVDALINNAAVQVEKSLLETKTEEWDLVFNTNVRAIFLLSQLLAPKMRPGSAIVNISSVHARATSKGMTSYVASKGAVSALTRAMALELSDLGIRVNAILPGAIDTPMLQKGLLRNKDPKAAFKKLSDASPLKKIGQGSDIAKLAFFLTDSELSGNITGQEFASDGGVLAQLASEE